MSDDRESELAAGLAGAGLFRIGLIPPELLSSGRLVRVLAQWEWPGGRELSMLYRRTFKLPQRVSAFMELGRSGPAL